MKILGLRLVPSSSSTESQLKKNKYNIMQQCKSRKWSVRHLLQRRCCLSWYPQIQSHPSANLSEPRLQIWVKDVLAAEQGMQRHVNQTKNEHEDILCLVGAISFLHTLHFQGLCRPCRKCLSLRKRQRILKLAARHFCRDRPNRSDGASNRLEKKRGLQGARLQLRHDGSPPKARTKRAPDCISASAGRERGRGRERERERQNHRTKIVCHPRAFVQTV